MGLGETYDRPLGGEVVGDPFRNNSEIGITGRRTMYGFAIPKDDLLVFKGEVMYDKISKFEE